MARFLFIAFLAIVGILPKLLEQGTKGENGKITAPDSKSSMPHRHKKEGVYETYSKKTHDTKPGAMPHKHETKHYTSMADASNLPKGYILLNGEPVRVADLEDK